MTEVRRATTTRLRILPALLVCAAAPAFFVLEIPWLGWALLALGIGASWLLERGRHAEDQVVSMGARRDTAKVLGVHRPPSLTRDLSLIAVGLLIVSIIPLAAELDNLAMLRFTLALGGAVAVPYAISRFVYRDRAIGFPWRTHRRWGRLQWGWLVAVLVLGWLILPFYFITSGVYQNWPVVDTPDLIARLFVGVGAVGIWDELFFICTVFALLRRHFPDLLANLLQAIVFVSFLWELGYREWGPLLTIPFALLQGYIFLRTHSLAYVVTVHLLFDAVVFAVLVHAHNPGLLPIFLV
ncbi:MULTISPECIES: CPBP family intramembrane glutamic endopeptidase [unclassified Microbacterium]|uniref:CPBP family intramembrane glutamic endopeptidase n=1 Tax=unclassified Microbacterium TaxID=2609290 RepID=UPI00160530F6|nr:MULTISPECIES: CPBP family intramembrane glutamic endopeptidase [unclassified Microbacterium]QNA92341.1 CPBP family intramembrane metalloprotease [Microbacterium sp. Se63.02b]QYM65625.1 CPBP family intramembrane metalloprotease [Microbacterium sp. Se5.02b]